MHNIIGILEKLQRKSLKLPGSIIWYGVGINSITYIIYGEFWKDTVCQKSYLLFTLVITVILFMFLLIYNYYFYFGKKNKKNIIINLYSEDKNIDQFVYEINNTIEALLEENNQKDVNVIVPNYCRRANFSKSFLKKCKSKDNLVKSKVYKIFNMIWRSHIIIFGNLKERRNIDNLIVINNKLLIDASFLRGEQAKGLNFITKVKSENDQFLVLNKEHEYIEFKNLSCFLACISKYYIGIGYYLSNNIIDAYKSHKFIIDNDKKIDNYEGLDEFFYLESLFSIKECIDNKKYGEALSYIDFLSSHNIKKKSTIITKMYIIMHSTSNSSEFSKNVIECFKLLRGFNIRDLRAGLLTIAYLELCRGNYDRALKMYFEHFKSVSELQETNYLDIIEYCHAAKEKLYEKEIAVFCLTCIYLGLGDYDNFKTYFQCLNNIHKKSICKSDLYNTKKKLIISLIDFN